MTNRAAFGACPTAMYSVLPFGANAYAAMWPLRYGREDRPGVPTEIVAGARDVALAVTARAQSLAGLQVHVPIAGVAKSFPADAPTDVHTLPRRVAT